MEPLKGNNVGTDISNASVCSPQFHFPRRTLLRGLGGCCFLTPVAQWLAHSAEANKKERPRSVILLWLEGGPSQLETFDPHPGTAFGGQVSKIATSAKGVEISNLLPHTAEQMHHVALVRSVTSKEGDHERAIYNIKSGYRPDPTTTHPSIGAILCHASDSGADIPRHVSVLPGSWPARGGYLGAKFDAFKIYDPANPVPDVTARVSTDRMERRLADLQEVAEKQFAARRLLDAGSVRTLHPASTHAATQMMSSDQLSAFDVSQESLSERAAFGDTPFGRGCLAAARLIEVGVRCVEVTLGGWDSHINNHAFHVGGCSTLDIALAGLLKRLAERDLLETTLVVCGGEFGRTPRINAAEGRDHWPHGFSIALAGCGIRGGAVYGETAEKPNLEADDPLVNVADPVTIGDVHATILKSLGVPWHRELITPIGRPMKYADGKPLDSILLG